MTSCEQRLITKEHIAMHIINPFAIYSCTLVFKGCFKPKFVLSFKLKFLSNYQSSSHPHDTPTFNTEALRLASNVQLVKWLLL